MGDKTRIYQPYNHSNHQRPYSQVRNRRATPKHGTIVTIVRRTRRGRATS